MIKSGIYVSIWCHPVIGSVQSTYLFKYANESRPIGLVDKISNSKGKYPTRISKLYTFSRRYRALSYSPSCFYTSKIRRPHPLPARPTANPFIWLTSLQLFYLSKFPTTDLCDLFVSYRKKNASCYIFLFHSHRLVIRVSSFFFYILLLHLDSLAETKCHSLAHLGCQPREVLSSWVNKNYTQTNFSICTSRTLATGNK